ncbi:DUF2158 domain-containing protein [Chitinophagaceae bacterium LB-8]|uniref:DUF2158 domain-containing protein n=1 Tax=Paraflavisolibacter caeni TaxID=2982496 RepID=A0A9X2XSD2_9BACT|nr:DUF2158 domain-containing protein [Paraflavisolibacter caeni]MCU7547785.1 DUF2158 domain-containing protein [Paraflavisolibacter caeni]
MAEQTLQLGDVVILKSGSPKMTIASSVFANGNVRVYFYDTNKHELLMKELPSAILKKDDTQNIT